MQDCVQQDEVQLICLSSSLSGWPTQLTFPEPSEVQVWVLSSALTDADLGTLSASLTPEESERAQRYRFAKDKNQFMASRGLLRQLIGSYLGEDPRKIQLRLSAKAKPELSLISRGLDLRFNVAHSGALILFAFTNGRRMGVDVEEVRNDFETTEIAKRFFSSAEQEALRRLPASERHQAFFRCWTRKEAYIKAVGDGLSLPLDQFDVSLADDDPPQLLQTRPDPAEADRWRMHNLTIANGYPAALVVEKIF